MGRFTRRMFKVDPQEFSADENYNLAYRKVKRIKGFYSHLQIYFIVNAIIIISSLNRDSIWSTEFWNWDTFSTAIFWGIGLAAHAVSVFGRDLFFDHDWEQKKIKEFMEKEKTKTGKWE